MNNSYKKKLQCLSLALTIGLSLAGCKSADNKNINTNINTMGKAIIGLYGAGSIFSYSIMFKNINEAEEKKKEISKKFK